MFDRIRRNGDTVFIEKTEGLIETTELLPSGFYNPRFREGPFSRKMAFEECPVLIEKTVSFKEGIPAKVLSNCSFYFSEKTTGILKKLGNSVKLGVLLYGRQGTGKTTIARLVIKSLIEKNNAIGMNCTGKEPDFMKDTIQFLRNNGNANLLVILIDEIEVLVETRENDLLTLLDGEAYVDNVLFLGITNYLDKIPDRIKNRPSRFKYVYEVDSMPHAVYRQYVEEKIHETGLGLEIDCNELAFKAEEKGLTLDEFKHVLSDILIYNTTFETAAYSFIQ